MLLRMRSISLEEREGYSGIRAPRFSIPEPMTWESRAKKVLDLGDGRHSGVGG